MCGRFSLFTVSQALSDRFGVTIDEPLKPRYNISPSQDTPIIMGEPAGLAMARWGFIPSWAKEAKTEFAMINAKAETLLEKPAYRKPYYNQRCLVLADGFYEWKALPEGKVPYRFFLRGNEPFAFAGIYDRWRSPDGRIILSFTIVTIEPNSLVSEVHERMPAMLRREDEKMWLRGTIADAQKTLVPYPPELMRSYRISTLVNNPMNDTQDVVKPLATLDAF